MTLPRINDAAGELESIDCLTAPLGQANSILGIEIRLAGGRMASRLKLIAWRRVGAKPPVGIGLEVGQPDTARRSSRDWR